MVPWVVWAVTAATWLVWGILLLYLHAYRKGYRKGDKAGFTRGIIRGHQDKLIPVLADPNCPKDMMFWVSQQRGVGT